MLRRVAIALALIAFWMLPGAITAVVNISLFPEMVREGMAARHLWNQVATWVIWALFTPVGVLAIRRFPLERGLLRRSLVRHALVVAVCIPMYVAWSALVLRTFSPSAMTREEPFRTLLMGQLGTRAPLAVLLYAAIAGVTIAVDERRRRRDRELHGARLEADLARANLQALQMQLQPHFLFNTLHAIGMLVEEDPPRASRTIAQLGDLLRRTLSLADIPEITLREELDVLRDYLRIESTRFGDRLTVTIDASPDTLDLKVPSLVLQPLVENAVRHGVAPREEPGRITVHASRTGGLLRLDVEDDGPGFGASNSSGSGLGLVATRERIALLHGEGARLSHHDVAGGGTCVRLELPARA